MNTERRDGRAKAEQAGAFRAGTLTKPVRGESRGQRPPPTQRRRIDPTEPVKIPVPMGVCQAAQMIVFPRTRNPYFEEINISGVRVPLCQQELRPAPTTQTLRRPPASPASPRGRAGAASRRSGSRLASRGRADRCTWRKPQPYSSNCVTT